MAVDPLQLLREYTMARRPVVMEGDNLVFGEIRLPRSTETAFRSLKGQGPHYTLDACWFLLQHEDTKFPEYLVECSKHRFPKVSLVDKKELIAYLTGRSSSSPHISIIAPALALPSAMPASSSSASTALDGDLFRTATKRSATEAQLDTSLAHDEPAPSLAKKARMEPQDIELDDRLKESKRLVARRLEQPKGVTKSVGSSSSSEALPYRSSSICMLSRIKHGL